MATEAEAPVRVLRAGSDGLLVEVADLDEALALFAALREDPPAGVRELVPAARTVLVRFDPALTTVGELAEDLAGRRPRGTSAAEGPLVEVPVCYDGADLEEVARLVGLAPAEVVRRHTASPWTVAFTGFAPGFAYLAGGDPALDVPRRSEPRTSIPAGSVGLAGPFSGVYPRASPGGWQLVGRTGLTMWDLRRDEPALLAPGTRVRFVDAGVDALVASGSAARPDTAGVVATRALEVLAPGALSVVVDLGRPDRATQGVARSGAVDRGALLRADRLVGNPAGAAGLEVAGGGLQVRARGDLVVAVTGAPAPLTRLTAAGEDEPAHDLPFALDDGDELQLGTPARGMLTYLAVRGGVAGDGVLGSLSGDVLSGVGPPPLRAGTVVALADAYAASVAGAPEPGPPLPAPGEVVVVDVLLGPRDDWFTAEAVAAFLADDWTVTPRSNRVGLRLDGGRPLERARTDELPSEGTVPGSVQVPPNGRPVVFTADHPVTGGYPVVACVARHHLDRVGQVPVGGRIRFRAVP
ncbi:sensor histidine kinase inhibitor, KipI family [Microlunatus sagamiharensis]|uniref:Sensor histidine kinase inhibitor, KipI family n=1 Tax=Microlunatus sagamiharensis TaxID=546874 RepID=A0A1H2ME45_9ACTN|nr:urea amidolyase family protein [Microlunatus sagamiharensis]SDU91344.1 sensor histidine kinase inhibitor, KipI family [Microlunatus sagamiharensis]